MNSCRKYFSVCALALLTQAAFAQSAPLLGSASDFAVLSAGSETPPRTTVADPTAAATLTDSAVIGEVGSAGAVTLTGSSVNGTLYHSGALTNTGSTTLGMAQPLPAQVETDFDAAYAALAPQSGELCTTLATLGGSYSPGVYCSESFVVSTGGTLTLDGAGIYVFKIGASDPAAYLTGTNFTVNLINGATACNVYWWVAAGATMTDSNFKGTLLAGAAITDTRGTFEGRALAKAEVTLTGAALVGCEGATPFNPPHQRCNQGVGNGPEACDPGNSNQGNPFRSNDELGGIPGNPGRKGGNNK